MQRTQLYPLTSVRFLAALWVIVFHAAAPGRSLGPLLSRLPAAFSHVAATGYAAVGFFFVLSGFILAYTYQADALDRRAFWSARVARIYPVYLLGLLTIAPALLLHARRNPGKFDGSPVGSFIASALLVQAWVPTWAVSWNYPAWSLSVETFFYALFPLILALLRRLDRRGLAVVMALAAFASVSLSLVPTLVGIDGIGDATATGQVTGAWAAVFKYSPPVRLPEFVFGVALGRMFLARRRGETPASAGRWCCSRPWCGWSATGCWRRCSRSSWSTTR